MVRSPEALSQVSLFVLTQVLQGEDDVEVFALFGARFCSLGCERRTKRAQGKLIFASMVG